MKVNAFNYQLSVINYQLNKDYGLKARNLEAAAAADVFAHQHIVHAHHIIARFIKLGAVVLVHMTRRIFLFQALQPSNFIIIRLTAMRADVIGAFGFWNSSENSECGMRNAERGMGKIKRGMKSAE